MSKQKFVIAFPDSRNNTMYVDGTEKGNNSIMCAIEFNSVEEARKYMEEKGLREDCWIEDLEGEIQP